MPLDKPLLLFFTHRTSGPARKMESQLAHVAHKERERLRVSAIDVAESPELTDRLGVTHVPILILFQDRKLVECL
jgi:thioredoxin-like negative regulator of GroEL